MFYVFDDMENNIKTCRCKDQLFLNIFFIAHFDPLRVSNYSPSPLSWRVQVRKSILLIELRENQRWCSECEI